MEQRLENPYWDEYTGLVIDEDRKMVYDRSNLTIFQGVKYQNLIQKVRPDLTHDKIKEWTNDYYDSELTMMALKSILNTQSYKFLYKYGENFTSLLDPLSRQVQTFHTEDFTYSSATKVGSFVQMQKKINFYRQMKDKVNGYELNYPRNITLLGKDMARETIEVKERQKQLKDKFLREMGVDYSILA